MDERINVMVKDAESGQLAALEALKRATEQMMVLVTNDTLKSKEGRAGACEHHAYHIGLARQMMKSFVPKAQVMKDELKELGNSDRIAELLAEIWMSKVFIELEKELKSR